MSSHWKRIALSFAFGVTIALFWQESLAAPAADAAPEQTVNAGPIQATLKIDKASLNVAESLTATLTVRAPSGVRISLPQAETTLGGFSVDSTVDEPLRTVVTSKGEEQLLVRRYRLEPFLPGEYKFPSLEIRWQRSASESGVARTAEVKVAVESLLPKEAGEKGKALDPGTIRASYESPVPRDSRVLWLGVAIGFGAAAAIGSGIWIWGRRRRAQDEIAKLLERVENLRNGDRINPPAPDALHVLAGSLRGALADRLEPVATTANTRELVGRLEKNTMWGHADASRVGDVLDALDASRFGGSQMPASEFNRHVEAVVSMLTRLRALPSPGGVKR